MRRPSRPPKRGRRGPGAGAPFAHRPGGAVLLLALLVSLAACAGSGEEPPPSALTRSEFIEVVVAIRKAEQDVEREDSAGIRFQARKDSILAAHETTEAELYEFLERHTDLHYMDEVWDSITQRLKRPLRDPTDTARRPPTRGPVRQDDDGRGVRLRPGG